MNRLTQRIIGLALIVASLVGLAINIMALVYLPRLEREVQGTVSQTLSTISGTLETTEQALMIVDQSLVDVGITTLAVQNTTLGVAQSLSDTVPLLDTMAAVMGDELPATLDSTQRSLGAAQDGALAIDAVLIALATVPFLGGPQYNPSVTLSESLQQISDDLEPLNQSLVDIQSNIVVASSNLTVVQRDVTTLADSFAQIDATLADAQEVNVQYKLVVEEQQTLLDDLLFRSPTWITWGTRGIAGLLLWLAVAQFGLLSQGIEMMGRSRAS